MPESRSPLIILAFIVALLAGCGKTPPLRIAAHPWPGYDLLFLARDEGWLDARQVRLIQTGSASDSMHLLAQGLVDGAALTLDEVLRLRQEGVPLTVALVFDVSHGADMLLARPGIASLADLRGRRIGAETTALGALMLAAVLKEAGLTRYDVEVVTLPVDRHEIAWQQGRVDALITFEPTATRLLAQGAVRLFDSRRIPDRIVDVLAVRCDREEAHCQALRHLAVAHFRAREHLRNNPADALPRLARFHQLTPEQMKDLFRGLHLPGVTENREYLGGQQPRLHRAAQDLVALMLEAGLLVRRDDLEKLTNAAWLPQEAP